MTPAISVQHLTKTYGRTRALDDLSLTVAAGEFYGFLGPNGAGKTTTIRVITGMVRADSGDVLVNGVTADRRSTIARSIGVVPESRGFYDWMTAAEYLDFFAGLYGSHEPDLARTLLEAVGLPASRDDRVGTFSRGMRQRLGLARALVNRPKVLFLDEPTLGLDPQGQRDTQDLFRRLNAEGVTVFLSSHLLHEVASLCTRVAVVNQGRLVAEGTVAELRRQTGLQTGYRVKLAAGQAAPDFGPFRDRARSCEAAGEFVFDGDLEAANELLAFLHARKLQVLEFGPEEEDLTGVFLALTRRASEAGR